MTATWEDRFSIAPSPVKSLMAGTLKLATLPQALPDPKPSGRDEYVYHAPVVAEPKLKAAKAPSEPKPRKVHAIQQVRNPEINNRMYGVPKRSKEVCSAAGHEYDGKSLWRKDGINRQGHQKYQCLSCGVSSKDRSDTAVGAKPIERDCDHEGYKLWNLGGLRRRCSNCKGSWTVKI